MCKGHLKVQFYTEKRSIKGISKIRKCIIRLSGIWNTHTHTDLGDHPNVLLSLVLFAGELCLESSWWNASDSRLLTGRKSVDFSKINYFLYCLCFGRSFPGFTLWVKEALSCLILLSTLSLTPPACSEDVTFQGPRWKTEPSDLILPINTPDQRATITCEAEGSPPPQYR